MVNIKLELMKNYTFLLLVLLISLWNVQLTNATNFSEKKIPEVQKLDQAPNLFQSGDMFFSGQPSLGTLEWLKDQGVDLVINLRTEDENEDFAETAFNEEEQVDKLKMDYFSLPVSGHDGYSPENLKKFAEALNGKYKKVLIHCGSAGRVTNFMMAYLVEYKDYPLSDAIEFGKQIKFSFPLEDLLSKEIIWDTK